MKTYPFIVINKGNMKELRHYKTVEGVATYLFGANLENYIVIKNEKQIIDLSSTKNFYDIMGINNELKSVLRGQ